MALKTTNYKIKRLGSVLPEAYAIIQDLYINKDQGIAIIVIQQNRDLALELDPYEVIEVPFIVNRNENPYATAYNEAKKKIEHTSTLPNGTKRTGYKLGPLAGWEDDIIENN